MAASHLEASTNTMARSGGREGTLSPTVRMADMMLGPRASAISEFDHSLGIELTSTVRRSSVGSRRLEPALGDVTGELFGSMFPGKWTRTRVEGLEGFSFQASVGHAVREISFRASSGVKHCMRSPPLRRKLIDLAWSQGATLSSSRSTSFLVEKPFPAMLSIRTTRRVEGDGSLVAGGVGTGSEVGASSEQDRFCFLGSGQEVPAEVLAESWSMSTSGPWSASVWAMSG